MGLDNGLSNLSLVYITVSFYTLTQTSSILFLLVFAFALRIMPISLRLTAAVMVMAAGELLTVHGETQLNVTGFLLCIAASACSGMRWVLLQRVLHGDADGGGGVGRRGHGGRGGVVKGGLRASHGMTNPPVMLSRDQSGWTSRGTSSSTGPSPSWGPPWNSA
mmetsp:Transcript_32771/g.80720  ORF Transcript_32771/g.80720 Transcript_32771/m.80720 type:complete len:163 (+) Transcript_32771:772-1260(+)